MHLEREAIGGETHLELVLTIHGLAERDDPVDVGLREPNGPRTSTAPSGTPNGRRTVTLPVRIPSM